MPPREQSRSTLVKRIDRARREPGQIIVLFAVFIIILMVLAGSAYDYASIVIDDATLQNAVDSAVLAGSNSLAANSQAASPVTIARATAIQYLALNGVATQTPGTTVNITFPTSTPVGSNPSSSVVENIALNISRTHPTAFWPLVGLNSVLLQDGGAAHAQHSMLDVMLSLDTTGSLVLSNNLHDYTSGLGGPTVQDAVTTFINQMGPTTANPRGVKIGLGRYAGVKCTWYDSTGPGHTGQVGAMDTYTAASPVSEYRAPCVDDDTRLTSLSNDQQLLLTIASNTGTATCPAVAVGYGCPLQHKPFNLTNNGLNLDGIQKVPIAPYFTGTKEPNAICLVNPNDALCTESPTSVANAGFAWSTINGGRNCISWPCGLNQSVNQARRIQIIMTDGEDEAWPSGGTAPGTPNPSFPENVTTYDANFLTLANRLKGPTVAPDGGPPVEVFIVGYFCTNNPTTYSASSYPPNSFCESKLAYTPPRRVCPGPSYPAGTGSPVDDLLVSVSSSTAGTCDHYFPMSKNESLSDLLADLAGSISRSQLSQ